MMSLLMEELKASAASVHATPEYQDTEMDFNTHADRYTNGLRINQILADRMLFMFNNRYEHACNTAFIPSTVDVEVDRNHRSSSRQQRRISKQLKSKRPPFLFARHIYIEFLLVVHYMTVFIPCAGDCGTNYHLLSRSCVQER